LEYSRPGMEIDLNFVVTERALHLELQNLNWKFKPDDKFQKFEMSHMASAHIFSFSLKWHLETFRGEIKYFN